MEVVSNNKTIAKNTVLLYFRMIFVMLVTLYTSRVNLDVLGVVDIGLYQVVGGVVAMFAFLTTALSGATSRFLTFELGRGNAEGLKKTFIATVVIHIIVGLVIIILAETIGLWFCQNKLNVPNDRVTAVNVVYHFSIITAVIHLLQVPFNAAIIAHERMKAFAYLSIADVVMKLLVCYALYITPFDRLISYGVLMSVGTSMLLLTYYIYCHRSFEECKLGEKPDMKYAKPILAFCGWDLFGNFSIVARNQGSNIILNMFFGPVINAAAGFSTSISNAVLGFTNNILTAIKPPIVKSYSSGNIGRMQELMTDASKYAFSLFFLLVVPFVFESDYILRLWLKTPPEYTDQFCVLELIATLMTTMFAPIMYAIHASGRIRVMSIINGAIWVSVLPISYFIIKLGGDPLVPYYVKIVLAVFIIAANVIIVKRLIPEFNMLLYFKKGIIPSLLVIPLPLLLSYLVYSLFDYASIWRFLSVCTASTLSICVCFALFILNKETRALVFNKALSFVNKRR